MDDTGADLVEWHPEVVETAPVPVAVYDREGTLKYANQATVDFVNAEDRSAVRGRSALDFVAPELRETASERLERVVEEHEAVPPRELEFEALDGQRKHATVAGAPVAHQGEVAGQAILNDITTQKRREDELRRQRDRFETLFEHLPTPAVLGVAEEGEPIVRRVNQQFEDVFGYSTSEIRGQPLREYIVPEDKRDDLADISERILQEDVFETEVRRTTADGPRDFLLRAVTRDRENGPPMGYAIYVDITERKQSRRRLKRQNERLDELASLVAHDLRNPLTVARGHLELVREGEGDLGRVADAHDRMEEIIDDLLALARYGDTVTDRSSIELANAAKRAWSMCDTGDSELVVEASTAVLGDETRLCELFENLIRNAIDHNDTPVTVRVGCTDDGSGFYVADDGRGIPPAERDAVFDPGHSNTDEGTGYGLTIVRRLAEAHDWEVEVDESDDGGARFVVRGVDVPEGD